MYEIFKYVKEHFTPFITGFFSGGIPVGIGILRVPSMLGVVGDIIKGTSVLLFSTVSGLLLVVMTDLYKHYIKEKMISIIDKLHNKLFKNDKTKKQSKEKDKAA